MISEMHLLWSRPTSLDVFVINMPHRVSENIYDILTAFSFSLLYSWMPQWFPHWARARICCQAWSFALFAVPRCEGAGICVHGFVEYDVPCPLVLIWFAMAIWYDILCYGVMPLFWFFCVVALASGGWPRSVCRVPWQGPDMIWHMFLYTLFMFWKYAFDTLDITLTFLYMFCSGYDFVP